MNVHYSFPHYLDFDLTTSVLQVGPVHPVPAHRDLELLQPRDGRHRAHPGDLPAGQAEELRQHRQQGPEPQWTLNTEHFEASGDFSA